MASKKVEEFNKELQALLKKYGVEVESISVIIDGKTYVM